MGKNVIYKKAQAVRSKGFLAAQGRIVREMLEFETVIDMDALEEMARKAASNKSGKSSDGPLSVRIVHRYDI